MNINTKCTYTPVHKNREVKDRRKIMNIEKAFKYFSNRDHINIPRVEQTCSRTLNEIKV